jgi:hypothetical protein
MERVGHSKHKEPINMGQIVTVNFRGDQLYGFENDDGVFVALKPIVESMGMDWSAQLKRVKRDPILAEGMAIMATPFGRGGDQDAVCLKMELVNGWLFTIDSSRIKDDAVREKVILYQRECHGVLFKHFYKGAKHTAEPLVLEDHEETANPDGMKVRLVTECRQTFGAKASGQLWFQLGLPTVPAMIEQSRQYDLLDFASIKTAADQPTANAA